MRSVVFFIFAFCFPLYSNFSVAYYDKDIMDYGESKSKVDSLLMLFYAHSIIDYSLVDQYWGFSCGSVVFEGKEGYLLDSSLYYRINLPISRDLVLYYECSPKGFSVVSNKEIFDGSFAYQQSFGWGARIKSFSIECKKVEYTNGDITYSIPYLFCLGLVF